MLRDAQEEDYFKAECGHEIYDGQTYIMTQRSNLARLWGKAIIGDCKELVPCCTECYMNWVESQGAENVAKLLGDIVEVAFDETFS